jgi:xanthine dehydrogenase accessory factor
MNIETLEALRRARAEKRPVAVVTALRSGVQVLIEDGGSSSTLPPEVLDAARRAIRQDASTNVDSGNDRYFVHVFNPPLRLVIVGAVHISQPLARMAQLTGYDIVLVDPRGAWATADRFPGLTLMDDWPDDALERLKLDRRTAVVTLSHDPKLDDPALTVALRSDVFYIGALGSRKTHGSRAARLREQGFTDAEIGRIHGPIGLNLGGRAPAEIALAIVAQMTQVLYGAGTEMRERAA